MSEHEKAMRYLDLFRSDTYGLEIPRPIARYLLKRRFIEWTPPKFGTALYAITDAGKEALKAARWGGLV